MAAVNWSDPCARAAALSAAYYALISGQQEVKIETRTLDGTQVVEFQKPDINRLEAELRDAQGECAAVNGAPNSSRRFAITAGSRRRGRWC